MINQTFKEWAEKRKTLDESKVIRREIENPFLHVDQSQGDFVYFGVHDLFNYFKENGRVPKELPFQKVSQKMGQIKDIDQKKNTVKVALPAPLTKMGYRSLKSKTDKNGQFYVNVPIGDLSDFTTLMGSGATLSGDKLWLASSNNHQKKKMRQLKNAEMRQQAELQNRLDQIAPQQKPLPKNDPLAGLFSQPSTNITPDEPSGLDQMFAPQKPAGAPLQKFVGRQNSDFFDRIKNQSRLDVAHYDPLNAMARFHKI